MLLNCGVDEHSWESFGLQDQSVNPKENQPEYSSEDAAAAAAAKSLQSCLTLCNPIDSRSSGFPVPGILQARTLEWVAISFSNAWKWKVKVKSLSLTLSNPMDCSLPGSSVHGIFQARVPEWGAIAFSRKMNEAEIEVSALMLKLKFHYSGHLKWRADSLEKMLAGGEGGDRRWDGWMASSTQWTWVWASSRRWWRTGKSSVLQSMGSQRVRHNWATEQQQQRRTSAAWWTRSSLSVSVSLQPRLKKAASAHHVRTLENSTHLCIYRGVDWETERQWDLGNGRGGACDPRPPAAKPAAPQNPVVAPEEATHTTPASWPR